MELLRGVAVFVALLRTGIPPAAICFISPFRSQVEAMRETLRVLGAASGSHESSCGSRSPAALPAGPADLASSIDWLSQLATIDVGTVDAFQG